MQTAAKISLRGQLLRVVVGTPGIVHGRPEQRYAHQSEVGVFTICQRCEICQGEVQHGVCLSCGLPAEDYISDNDVAEEVGTEQREDRVPPAFMAPTLQYELSRVFATCSPLYGETARSANDDWRNEELTRCYKRGTCLNAAISSFLFLT